MSLASRVVGSSCWVRASSYTRNSVFSPFVPFWCGQSTRPELPGLATPLVARCQGTPGPKQSSGHLRAQGQSKRALLGPKVLRRVPAVFGSRFWSCGAWGVRVQDSLGFRMVGLQACRKRLRVASVLGPKKKAVRVQNNLTSRLGPVWGPKCSHARAPPNLSSGRKRAALPLARTLS